MPNNSRNWGCKRRSIHEGTRRHTKKDRRGPLWYFFVSLRVPSWMRSMSQKTWGGRFSGETDNRVEAFTESISFDRRLYRHDLRASQAHARMLAEVGLLSAAEAGQIVTALADIEGQIDRDEFAFSVKLEDIHTHIERALIERLGDVGRKLHTSRSRN